MSVSRLYYMGSRAASTGAKSVATKYTGKNIVLVEGVRTPFLQSGTDYVNLTPHELQTKAILKRHLTTAPKAHVQQSRETPKTQTETSSFVMNLFTGDGKVSQLFPYPKVLTDEEIQTVDMAIDPILKRRDEFDALKIEAEGKFGDKYIQILKDMGLFGIQVPVDYGGIGMNNTQYARIADLTAHMDISGSVFLGAHQSIGFKGISLYGTDEQKQKYLPDLAAGNRIACFCLTEPSAGSDASGIKCRAELSPDGKHYILNGSKIWISNGGIADVFTVFAKTPVTTTDGKVQDKVTAFIVEREFGGVTSGPPEKKMGIKASNTAEVFFDNVKIPTENILGEVGGGFKVAMHILNNGRFGMAAALSGTMKSAIAMAVAHANTRTQFGNKIATYGAIQEKIARMSMYQYAGESMAYMLSGIMDKGFTDFQLEAAISKIYASEAAWYVVDEALQTLGGMGYMHATGLEKILRDARIFRIFEGTNEILRLFIALTGLQYAGGHLKELQRAMQNPVGNMGMIFGEGTKRVKRAVGLSSGPSLSEYVHPDLRENAALVSKAIENFGASVEHMLIKYNKNVIHEQFLLKRLGDAAIDIYAMVVVLSRATRALNKNISSAEHEKLMTNVICTEASLRIIDNLGSLRANDKLKIFASLKTISESVCANDGVVQDHPLS